MPLVKTRWIAIRLDRKTGVEFYDWDTLAVSQQEAVDKAKREDYLTGCGRAYPVVRVVVGEFVESRK